MNANQVLGNLNRDYNVTTDSTGRKLSEFGQYKAAAKVLMDWFNTPKIALNSPTAKLADYVLEQYSNLKPASAEYCNLEEKEAHMANTAMFGEPLKVQTPTTSVPSRLVTTQPKVYSFKDMVKASKRNLLKGANTLSALAGKGFSPLKYS